MLRGRLDYYGNVHGKEKNSGKNRQALKTNGGTKQNKTERNNSKSFFFSSHPPHSTSVFSCFTLFTYSKPVAAGSGAAACQVVHIFLYIIIINDNSFYKSFMPAVVGR